MDGHFVPAHAFSPRTVAMLANELADRDVLLDVHLMVERPERHVADFAKAGADNITVHVEATPHVHYALQAIHEAGCTAGLALCPSTPVSAASEVLGDVDVLLCMTVNPGWGGQTFIPASLGKIERLRAMLAPNTALEVDGGIDAATAGPCARAGATLFVAGTSVFGSSDPAHAVRELEMQIQGTDA
jgi:ribulose-phosphate 3-epimerase